MALKPCEIRLESNGRFGVSDGPTPSPTVSTTAHRKGRQRSLDLEFRRVRKTHQDSFEVYWRCRGESEET